ncbi:hypothetical protein L227DRAFT_581998 [Lentinus tigrinus ALCF2SS1-6]|uniref:Homeobox domain-containing protein n=1 Tax=Lentinus tigrinus ALCF2SS1-6 TaxID=1328759 RepID=A0A5C2RNA1_9APHY|nr:hypothetical protein L227DRAFT_581998 [Lentinus tigrinus ALCF2SS1-6]
MIEYALLTLQLQLPQSTLSHIKPSLDTNTMVRARVYTPKGYRTLGMSGRAQTVSGMQDKYLPKEAYLILREFHEKVTAYPSKQQKKELASVIAKLPGARGCTTAKISAYFKERRKTVARAHKPVPEAASSNAPLAVRIGTTATQKVPERACTPSPPCPPVARADDLAGLLRDALSELSTTSPISPPKTFAELGRWCRETDTFSESLLDNIAAGVYEGLGMQ